MSILKFSNQRGFPMLESTAINDGTGVTTITFNPHNDARFFGGFWVKIALTLATSSNVILFTTSGVSNSTVPVYLSTGVLATAANFISTGQSIHLCFYDRDSLRVQLIA